MADFVCGTSFKGSLLALLAQVIDIHPDFLRCRARGVDTPETYPMVGSIIEKSGIVFVGTHGKPIDQPRTDLGTGKKSIEAEPYVWSLAHIHDPAGAILQFLAARSHLHRSPGSSRTQFE